MPSLAVTTMLAALIVLLCAMTSGALAAVPGSFVLQYAVGNASADLTWRHKASLLVTGMQIQVESQAERWKVADVRGLRAGEPYRLRIVEAAEADAGSRANVLAAMHVSPCVLMTAKQYANTPIKHTYERIALSFATPASAGESRRPVGIRMDAKYVDTVCELAVFAPSVNQAASKGLAPDADSSLAMSFKVAPAAALARPPTPPKPGMPGSAAGGKASSAKGAEGGAKKDANGKEEPEPDNRSFFEKYWLYIVIFVGYSIVSSIFAPQQAAAAGGQKGAAAPAAAGAARK